jgi:hypothetical protein
MPRSVRPAGSAGRLNRLRLLVWTVIGIAIYAGYGYRHSTLPAEGR